MTFGRIEVIFTMLGGQWTVCLVNPKLYNGIHNMGSWATAHLKIRVKIFLIPNRLCSSLPNISLWLVYGRFYLIWYTHRNVGPYRFCRPSWLASREEEEEGCACNEWKKSSWVDLSQSTDLTVHRPYSPPTFYVSKNYFFNHSTGHISPALYGQCTVCLLWSVVEGSIGWHLEPSKLQSKYI